MNKMNDKDVVILNTWHSPYARLKPVSITNVSLEEGFWHSRVWVNQSVTLQTQYKLLESTGRLDNFRRVSGEVSKPFQGFVFNDSDVYKWLEAAAWTMSYCHDDELNHLVDTVITLIVKAQDKNGYLNTYFSVERSGERWTNLREKHELYCAGHLIQAAIAHYRVTGEWKLLNPAIHLADHIYTSFGPSGREGTSGHPEIEMALVELSRTTGDKKYLDLAAKFIDRRGYGLLGGGEYLLDHLPLRKMDQLAGHTVRALYLCSGAADLVLESGESELMIALEKLWTNMVHQQMYVTGGVGSRHEGEAFGKPYELPNGRAYAESCAAIASLMWNWRMLQNQGDARYADLLEWTLYNAVLPGISLDGREYFYINPLKGEGEYRRQAWFDCACCPPNISRTIAMLPGTMYSLSEEGIWLHLYAPSKANIELLDGTQVGLQVVTSYPWDGRISLQIASISPIGLEGNVLKNTEEFSIFLRIPEWVENDQVIVKINDELYPHEVGSGIYLEIHRHWYCGDRVDINLPMKVRYIESHPLVEENNGRIAVSRGPILYCLEASDNKNGALSDIQVDLSKHPEEEFQPDILGGIMQLHLKGRISPIDKDWSDRLYRVTRLDKNHSQEREIEVTYIPYYAWANRTPGAMTIWNRFY